MNELERLGLELEALGIQHGEKQWVQFTTGMDHGVERAKQKIVNFLKDPENYKIVCNYLERDLPPHEKRAAFLLHQEFKSHHYSDKANKIFEKITGLETHLSDLLNKHRVVLNGREVTSTALDKILSENPDREARKQAFLARAQVNRKMVAEGFVDLLNARKEYALACGANDFVAFRLEKDELEPDLFADFPATCRERKARLKEAQIQLAQRLEIGDRLMPWDTAYAKNLVCKYNKAKVDIIQFLDPIEKTFAAYGFEIRNLNLTFDVFPRKNKSEWGYSFTLGVGRDSRVLANVDDRFSNYWVLLHETAHGVHFMNLKREEVLLNKGVSGIVAEGFANFFGDLCYSREFLRETFADDFNQAHAQFQNLQALTGLNYFMQIEHTLFDQALYQNDLRNLNDIQEVNWSIQNDLLGIPAYADECPWGYRIHHTIAPVYLHNYYLGDILCSDMKKAYLAQGNNQVDPPGFGRFWREKVLEPSGRYPFMELYQRVCQSQPNLGAFLDDVLNRASTL